MSKYKIKIKSGFSFVAISIIMLFIGLVMYGTISKIVAEGGLQQTRKTKQKLYAIEKSINDFIVKENRLPCPSSLVEKFGSDDYGDEQFSNNTCDTSALGVFSSITATDLVYGAVPVRTLGLKDSDGIDEWGGKISYVVDRKFASKTLDADENIGFAYYISDDASEYGDILLDDRSDEPVVFLVLSHGKDKVGAYDAFADNEIEVYGDSGDTNFVDNGDFDESFATSGVGIDDLVVFGTKDEIRKRSFTIDTENYKACICQEYSYAGLEQTLTWNKARCGEIVESNEVCPSSVTIGQATDDYYYLSAGDQNKPSLQCQKDGNWEDDDDMRDPCLKLPNCSTGTLESDYLGYTITWTTNLTPYANTSKATGEITVIINEVSFVFNVFSYCKVNDKSDITHATMGWTTADISNPLTSCSAITSGSSSSGYATWAAASTGDTVTGVCFFGYANDGTAPTRDCTKIGWGSITNPCVVDSGIRLWLDAENESSVTKNASNLVSQWNDKSGNGYNAVQVTEGSRPIYTASGLNGKNVLVNDGTTWMVVPSIPLTAATTVFVVAQSNSGNMFFMEQSVSASLNNGFYLFAAGVSPAYVKRTTGLAASNNINWTGFDAVVMSYTYDLANMYYYKNGELQGSKAGVLTDAMFTDDLYIGSRAGSSIFHIGKLAEIIIYNEALSSSKRAAGESYLANKWLIATSGNTCSAVTSGGADEGYATWAQSYEFDNPITGTCISGYEEDGTAPTRNCVNATWGTVSNPCVPSISMNGLSLWLDANDTNTVTLNGSNVSNWADKSGNSNDVSNASSTYQPTYTDTLNGKPVLTFVPNDYLYTNNSNILDVLRGTDKALTVIKIVKFNNPVTTSIVYGWSDSTQADFLDYWYENERIASTNYQLVAQDQAGVTPYVSAKIGGSIDTNYHIWSTRKSLATIDSYIDSSQIFTVAGRTTTFSSSIDTFTVGAAMYRTNFAYGLKGDIAEFIVYNRFLDSDELDDVELYLANKWELIIPGNTCSAITSGGSDSGYATWAESYEFDNPATGTCISGYEEDGTAPTRNCTDGEWQTVSNPCVASIPTSGLTLWLDGNDANTITLNGSSVSNWADKSGNSNDFSQGTALNQPLYVEDGVNGNDVISFDGTNHFLTSGTYKTSLNPSEMEMFIVAEIKGGSGTNRTPFSSRRALPSVNLVGYNYYATSIDSWQVTFGKNTSSWISLPTDAPYPSVTNDETLILDFNAGTSGAEFYIDGTVITNGTTTEVISVNPSVVSVIGASSDSGNAARWYGYINEIILYNRKLSALERTQVNDYLSTKWGI